MNLIEAFFCMLDPDYMPLYLLEYIERQVERLSVTPNLGFALLYLHTRSEGRRAEHYMKKVHPEVAYAIVLHDFDE